MEQSIINALRSVKVVCGIHQTDMTSQYLQAANEIIAAPCDECVAQIVHHSLHDDPEKAEATTKKLIQVFNPDELAEGLEQINGED